MFDYSHIHADDMDHLNKLEAAAVGQRILKGAGSAFMLSCVSIVFNPCMALTGATFISTLAVLSMVVFMGGDVRKHSDLLTVVASVGLSLFAVITSLIGGPLMVAFLSL